MGITDKLIIANTRVKELEKDIIHMSEVHVSDIKEITLVKDLAIFELRNALNEIHENTFNTESHIRKAITMLEK